MPKELASPETDRVLRTLKDFQRDTVDYVFKRMYEEDPPARRFLVADEVGLGKTLVAKGIVARAIEHLRGKDPGMRIDIIYICSNLAIARQNINRLNLTGRDDHHLPDRITLLPRDVQDLKKQRLNFISFTPGTSFDLRSSYGRAEERALLYWLLPECWKSNRRGALSMLARPAGRAGFERRVDDFPRSSSLDQDLGSHFQLDLERVVQASRANNEPDLQNRFLALADQLGGRERLTDQEREESASIVGELRATLATSCLHALEPDLIILDEFQRFRDLLYSDNDACQLARKLFTWPEVRLLLLSATPYKMYTLADETDSDDHFTDFVQTVGFLHDDRPRTESFNEQIASFRRELFRYGEDDGSALRAAKQVVEESLRRVMVRTERLAVSPDRNGMLRQAGELNASLEPQDVSAYVALQKVSRLLGQGDTIEYWKSAPYLLNFMDDYQLKREFEQAARGSKSIDLFRALAGEPGVLLSWEDIEAYRRIDPGNARLRALLNETIERGAWSLFWLPPALPYYRLDGAYAQSAGADLTKRLVFSSWQVVPKVIAACLSYEAERRLFNLPEKGEARANTHESRRRRARLLQFTLKDGKPARMPVLAMAYPSIVLTKMGDPWQVATERRINSTDRVLPSLNQVLGDVRDRVASLLDQLPYEAEATQTPDERWYWAAPVLLDLMESDAVARHWFGQPNLAVVWRGGGRFSTQVDVDGDEAGADTDTAWAAHVALARRLLEDAEITLGSRPSDLPDVLARLAVAGPAIVSLRSLCRVCGGLDRAAAPSIRNLAGRVAHSFLSMFNLPEVAAGVRQTPEEEVYWRRVLEYAADGCIQAVMDEYAHVLVEWRGVAGKSWQTIAEEAAAVMVDVLSLRAANIAVDVIRSDIDKQCLLVGDKARFRSRFAARYGGQGVDELRSVERQSELQKAFNSPFWPYVLCTTSVGQEGLDFHLYCHAVVHWNLPANPVDLEQREGRVHRYKGHAIRKNIARRHGENAFRVEAAPDPWVALFRSARDERSGQDSDLVPYWVYAPEGGSKIERHIPVLALSREVERTEQLRKSLAVYRMAFGQSRQEDLLAFLAQRIPQDRVDRAAEDLRIDLSPDRSPARDESGKDPEPGDFAVEHHELPQREQAHSTTREPPHLDDLRELLDRFAALKKESLQHGQALGQIAQPSVTLEQLMALLDRFRAIRATQLDAELEKKKVRSGSLEKWRDFLDRFAIVQPKRDSADTVERFKDLLDGFRNLKEV